MFSSSEQNFAMGTSTGMMDKCCSKILILPILVLLMATLINGKSMEGIVAIYILKRFVRGVKNISEVLQSLSKSSG